MNEQDFSTIGNNLTFGGTYGTYAIKPKPIRRRPHIAPLSNLIFKIDDGDHHVLWLQEHKQREKLERDIDELFGI